MNIIKVTPKRTKGKVTQYNMRMNHKAILFREVKELYDISFQLSPEFNRQEREEFMDKYYHRNDVKFIPWPMEERYYGYTFKEIQAEFKKKGWKLARRR